MERQARSGRARGFGRRAAVALLAIAIAAAGCAAPAPSPPRRPDPRAVAAAVTERGLSDRVRDLAEVTPSGNGFRAVGSSGYEAAAALVEQALRDAGWSVSVDTSDGVAFTDGGGASVSVGGRTFDQRLVRPLIFAPAGTVEGPVVALDWDPDATDQAGPGCFGTQYGDLPAHAIVLVRSGPCFRRDQVLAAQEAGASAFVAAYPALPDGLALRPTLIRPDDLHIPAIGVSRDVAVALAAAAAAGREARLVSDGRTDGARVTSIIAELPGSDPSKVVMLGAHLDSVIDGPGLNDDGSGVAALLEIARALAQTRARATVRLAFWSGEELGLHGSFRYVTQLPDEGRRAVLVYLNLDMLASPNGFAGVYNEPAATTVGSKVVHDLLVEAVQRAGGAPVDVDLAGGSDHMAFQQAGISTGGVFAGASSPVTAEQASASGSTAGIPADPCYHQACDDGSGLDLGLARVLTAAIADVTVRLANTPELLRP